MIQPKKIWTESIYDFEAFWIAFDIPINSNNYKEKIIAFDCHFLEMGYKFGMYKIHSTNPPFNELPIDYLINNYKENRLSKFLAEDADTISLLGFENWDLFKNNIVDNSFWDISAETPVKTDSVWHYEKYNVSRYSRYHSSYQLWIADEQPIFLHRLNTEWEKEASVSFHSESNIWLDTIYMTYVDDGRKKHIYTFFDDGGDNRSFAYRIVPRFNSFIREMKTKVISLDGKINVGKSTEGVLRGNLTTDGYLVLDNQIIFQEDIDSGKVKIPE